MKDTKLFDRIEQFRFPAAYFNRLIRENQWTREYGYAVIEEYRRFLYLASVSPHPVTPPIAVDQAWHLHLIHTRSYWEDLCLGTLPRPLHHGPTEGGVEEDEKFAGWYGRTMEFYEAEFGEKPPSAVWPPVEVRFDAGQRLRWMDTARYWVIPKPTRMMILPSLVPLGLLVSSGISTAGMVVKMVAASVMVLILVLLVRSVMRGSKGGSNSSGCGGTADGG